MRNHDAGIQALLREGNIGRDDKVVLDLFACEGLGTSGYQRAGYKVVAVDNDAARLKYNPADRTVVADAFVVLSELMAFGVSKTLGGIRLSQILLLHMSPPCQAYTRGNAGRVTSWPKLIDPCRRWALALRVPYVIENVKDAGPEMRNPTGLCGCMFDLHTEDTDGLTIHMQRLRLFEMSWDMPVPRECDHSAHDWVAGAYGGARRDKYEARYVRRGGYVPPDKDVVKALMGVDHLVTWRGLFEGLPPAYTEYIGNHLRSVS